MVRAATQLPRGRHGLSREEVRDSQRNRMLVAMADAVADKGYVHTTVADVLRGAGVSRETFYEHFRDKETCFLASFDLVADVLAQRLATVVGTEDILKAPPLERLDAALDVYLKSLASERAYARVYLIEVYAAGPAALARRVEMLDRFVGFVVAIVDARGDDRFACEAVVAAISSMVTMRVAVEDQRSLPKLHKPIMKLARRLLEPEGSS